MKPSRIKGKDPRARKARDNARRTTRSHKSAEKAARKIKAHANQIIRRTAKVTVRDAETAQESAATAPRAARREKVKVWPAANAQARREDRTKERAFLDTTAKRGPKGRRRAMSNRKDWDR